MQKIRTASTKVLALVLLVYSAPVAAQPAQPKPPLCDDDLVCTQLRTEAREHSKENRLDEARRAYDLAFQRRPDPMLLFNLARVLHKANRPADAVIYYQRYLDAGAEGRQDLRRKTEEYLEQARREAAAAAPPSATDGQTAQSPPVPPIEPKRSTPIYRKWWLWTAVGVTIAGIAVGVGLGVAARRPTDVQPVHPFP